MARSLLLNLRKTDSFRHARWCRAFAACALLSSLGTISYAQPFLYVANQNASNVAVINTVTNAVAATPATGFSPSGVALSPDGTRLYVANPNSQLVTVHNTANNSLVANLSIGQLPMAVAADATRLYVTLHGNAGLTVYNAATLGQIATVRVGFGPCAVAVSPANGRVYVANTFSNSVSVLDPTRAGTVNNPVIDTIPVPDSPIALALSPDGLTAWVVSAFSPTVTRINPFPPI